MYDASGEGVHGAAVPAVLPSHPGTPDPKKDYRPTGGKRPEVAANRVIGDWREDPAFRLPATTLRSVRRPEKMSGPAWFRLKVRHYEVDGYGHVNHATYVHYLETARLEALEELGMSLEEMRHQGYRIVATELAVRFHAPARSGDILEIETHIREFQGARSIWTQEIRHAGSQRLLVSAEVTGAFTTKVGRPVRIPPAFRQKLMTLFLPAESAPGERNRMRAGQEKGVGTRKGGGGHGAENS